MPGFQDCRICGERLRFEEALAHETHCLQRSYENATTESKEEDSQSAKGSSKEEDSQSVEKEDKEGNTRYKPGTWSMELPEDDNDEDDFFDTIFNVDRASQNVPYIHRCKIKPRNTKPSRTARSSSECHAHNSKYSGRRQSMPYDRTKPRNLFPPTKKYHYYPVTCQYCMQRFQPNKLKAHQRKAHFGETDEGPVSKRTQSSATKKGYTEEQKRSGPSKSVGSIPRRLQICYICGRMYGSKSLKIHEPKCLDKWRIQNDQLPPNRRAPEPVKQEPIQVSSGSKSLPYFDPVAEAAYLSHLNTLLPCQHCARTFSPDRLMKHESCCIERPKTKGIRKCITPTDGTIGR